MKPKWLSYSLVVVLCAVGVLAGMMFVRTNSGLAADSKEIDLKAACALLDATDTRSLMSAMFETKLLILCGRLDELSSGLELEASTETPTQSIAAWTDTLVNNPATDIGQSTTQSETSIRVNPTTGTICSAYNDSQHWAQGSIAFSGFSRSTDGGMTFTDRGPFPAGGGGNSFGDPSLIWRQVDGYFYYATLHTNGLGIWRSTDDCQNFTYLSMIHVSGGDDKEIMEVDNNPASPYYGRIYVAWTDFAAGSRIYSTYSDNGTTWSTPVALSAAGFTVQGAWPAVAPNGDVYVAWVRWNPYPTGPIDIEVVRSTDGGVSFAPVTNPMTGGVNPRDNTATANCGRPALNANVGDGIRYLPSPQIAAGPDGCLHVVYVRDPDGNGTGDVINAYYRRSCDNGATWGPEILLNDDGTLTDQYFPTISVGPRNVVVSTWYDRRNDPGSNYLIDYYKAYSYDGGITWGPNIRVSDVSTPIPQLNPNFDPLVNVCYYGDYDQQVQFDNGVYIQWSDSRNVQNGHPDPDIWFERERVAIGEVLLVDDDDNAPDVRAYYTAALDALGLTYDIWDTLNSDNEPDTAYLENYKYVVWFTGDEFGGFAGPGPAGEAALALWLDSISSIIGNWTIYYDWGCIGSPGIDVNHFFPDGTFTTDAGLSGTWTQMGDQVEWVFPNGTTYTGTISGNSMVGTMVDPSGNPGCWTADRIMVAATVTLVSGERTASGEPAEEPGLTREVYISPQTSLVPFGPPPIPEGVSSDETPTSYGTPNVPSTPVDSPMNGQRVGINAGPSLLYAPSEADDPAFRAAVAALTGGIVDYYDARAGTPTLPQLQAYDGVLTWANFAYLDNVAFGDVLADYVDSGGLVLLSAFTTYTNGSYLSGRIMTDAYAPVYSPTGGNHFLDSTYAGDGTTALHDGVSTYSCQFRDMLALQGAGAQDGSYLDGEIAVSYRPDFRVIHINGLNPVHLVGCSGDYPMIVANALSFSTNRCLLISSQDYLFDRGLTPFMQNYLGVASYTSDVGHITVAGAGSVYSGLGPYTLDYSTPGLFNYSDHLNPDATAEVAFTGDGGAGNAALDKYGATYFTSFLGYPYAAIPNLSDRADVMVDFILAGCAGPFPDIDVSPPSVSSLQNPDIVVVEPLNIDNVGWTELDWMIIETGQTSAINTDPWVLEALENVSSSPEGALTLMDVVADPSLMPSDVYTAVEPFESVSPDALTYYATRAAFDADFPGLPLEDFEEGNIAPGGIVGCPAPLDENNNDACFLPGDILPGILFQDDPGPDTIDGLALAGAGWNGNPSKQIMANTFVDSFDIFFTTKDTYAAGMDLASHLSADTVQITIYGPGGVILGTTTASATTAGNFWGVASDQYLTRIKIYSPANQAEGVDNIAFGSLPVCSAPVDIPWVSVNPTAGTTIPGGSTLVDVTFDSTGLTPGTYNGNLCVDSNDPDEPSVDVPVSLIVNAPPTISGLPNVIIDPSTVLPVTIDLWAYASDGETPDSGLAFTIEGSPPPGAGVSIVGNRWLTINPDPNWCPFTDITIRVTDPGGLWDNDTFRLGVTWSCIGSGQQQAGVNADMGQNGFAMPLNYTLYLPVLTKNHR